MSSARISLVADSDCLFLQEAAAMMATTAMKKCLKRIE
jgi:hypothetical protein